MAGSSEFGAVRQHRTSSNHCDALTYAHTMSCIIIRHDCGAFPCAETSCTVVWEGSAWSNRPELTPVGKNSPKQASNSPELIRTCPVGLLPPSSQWFEEVWCGRTAPNSFVVYLHYHEWVRGGAEGGGEREGGTSTSTCRQNQRSKGTMLHLKDTLFVCSPLLAFVSSVACVRGGCTI